MLVGGSWGGMGGSEWLITESGRVYMHTWHLHWRQLIRLSYFSQLVTCGGPCVVVTLHACHVWARCHAHIFGIHTRTQISFIRQRLTKKTNSQNIICIYNINISSRDPVNRFPGELKFLNFHQLEFVPRYRDPQLQVVEKWLYLFNLRTNIHCLKKRFVPWMWFYWLMKGIKNNYRKGSPCNSYSGIDFRRQNLTSDSDV